MASITVQTKYLANCMFEIESIYEAIISNDIDFIKIASYGKITISGNVVEKSTAIASIINKCIDHDRPNIIEYILKECNTYYTKEIIGINHLHNTIKAKNVRILDLLLSHSVLDLPINMLEKNDIVWLSQSGVNWIGKLDNRKMEDGGSVINKILDKKNGYLSDKIAYLSVSNNDYPMLLWAHHNNYIIGPDVFAKALDLEKLDIIIWGIQNKITIGNEVYDIACQKKDPVKFFTWLKCTVGLPSIDYYTDLTKNYHIHFLAWMTDNDYFGMYNEISCKLEDTMVKLCDMEKMEMLYYFIWPCLGHKSADYNDTSCWLYKCLPWSARNWHRVHCEHSNCVYYHRGIIMSLLNTKKEIKMSKQIVMFFSVAISYDIDFMSKDCKDISYFPFGIPICKECTDKITQPERSKIKSSPDILSDNSSHNVCIRNCNMIYDMAKSDLIYSIIVNTPSDLYLSFFNGNNITELVFMAAIYENNYVLVEQIIESVHPKFLRHLRDTLDMNSVNPLTATWYLLHRHNFF